MWWTLFTVVIAVSFVHYLKVLLFVPPDKKPRGIFDVKGLYSIYWIRWFWRTCEVWVEQLLTKPRMNNYDLTGSSYYTCGVTPTPSEEELEMPKPLLTDRHEDSMQMFGMDKDGRAVVATLVRLTQRRAAVILVVVDTNGDVYTLPGQPDTNYVNITDSGWKAGGLVLQCIEPMRCWRLKFNGLLRRGIRDEYITEDDEDTDEGQIVHARIDFLWHSIRNPVDVWKQASARLLGRALASHPRGIGPLFSLVDNMSLERDEYEQWGSLYGEVRLGGSPSDPPQVWHLKGCRRHRWGLSKAIADFHRSVEVFTYLDNGDVTSLQACSHGTKGSHYVLGYMQKAKCSYQAVTYTDLSPSVLEESGGLPRNILVKFSAGGESYDMWHKIGQCVTQNTGDPWSLTNKITVNSAAVNHSNGWGLTIFSDRYHHLCPVPERECLPPLPEPEMKLDESAPLVVGISNYLCRATILTGGKGASLGQLALLKDMTKYPFEVPDGIVVTVSGWQRQLQTHCALQQAVKVIEQAIGSSNQQQLMSACSRSVEVFQNAVICEAVAEAIKDLIEEEFDGGFENRRFAVRSSGCSEDSEDSSAAGQNETQLGVEGLDNILKALAYCWASQFTFQSVEYRRQRGQPVNGGMAVVVQEMVSADTAGVLFSQDPVTGNPANITITANYGLGESVVSASAEPDTIVVHRTWRDHLSVASVTRGSKETKCVMKESGGTSEVPVENTERTTVCLPDAVAIHLAKLALFLEQAYGSPRDIEFAVIKDTVYLLQARPVTSLESWTDFELIHEQNSGLLTDKELLTKANVGEVFPGALSPLNLSVISRCLDISFQIELERVYRHVFTFSPHYTMLCPSIGGHIFLNMAEIQYRFNNNKKTAVNDALDFAVHGKRVTTPEYVQIGLERFGFMSFYDITINMAMLAHDKIKSHSKVQKARDKFENFDIGENRATSAEVLYNEITRRMPDLLQICVCHNLTSRLSSSTQSIIFLMLAEEREEISEENLTDMAALLSSCTVPESADVPAALKYVSRVIAENEEAQDFLSMTYEEGKVWLESHPGLVGTAYKAFIAKHGHRCIKELDLMSLSWGLDSQPLFESLQAMVRSSRSYGKVKAAAPEVKTEITVEQAIDNLTTDVKSTTKRGLKFLLPMCRQAVADRESTKSLLTKVIDGFRKAYMKLGQLMVVEGRLPDSSLVFFLKHQEIGQLIKARSPVLISKAVRRKRLQVQLETNEYPDISMGMPKPVNIPETTHLTSGDKDLVLTGTTVCQGVIKATARVVTRLSEANTIKDGDILVTRCTDVGWTPYFPLLSGIITEIGGLISHGAVVAREYGLPSIVGVGGITHQLKSGDTIVLNATQGTITRINDDCQAHEGK